MKLPDHFEALGARVALLSDAGYPDYAAFGVLALAALLLCVFTGRRLVERGVARRIEDLRLSQEQFRQLTDNIQEVFWLIDTARQTMLYISPNYERVWGRTCASLYASREPWPDAVHPGDLARVRQFVTTSKSSGTYDEEFRIARPDGSIRWIRERAFPVRDATGAVYRIAGVAEDITDRKLTDTALKASETRFRSMLEGLEAGVVVHSADSRVTAFNAKATELLGVSAAQLSERTAVDPLWRRVDAEGAPLTDAQLPYSQARTRRHPVRGVVLGIERPALGDRVWLLVSANPLLGGDGNVAEVIVTFVDVSARVAAEREVRENASFIKDVLDSLSAHVAVLDESGVIVAVNEAWRRFARENGAGDTDPVGRNYLHGFRRGEVHGGGAEDSATSDAAGAEAGIRAVLSGRQSAFSMEYARPAPGKERWFRLRVTPLGGVRRGVVVAHMDISENKQATESVRSSQKRLRELIDGMGESMLVGLLTPQGIVIEANDPALAVAGLKPEAVIGLPFADAPWFADSEPVRERLRAAIARGARGEPSRCDIQIRGTGGRLIDVDFSLNPVRNENGAIAYLVPSANVITERKRAETELLWKTAFLEAQVASTIDGILIVDKNGRKILQNPQLADLLRIPREIAEDENDEAQRKWVGAMVKDPAAFAEKIAFLNAHPAEVSRDEIAFSDGMLVDRYSSPVLGTDGKNYGRIWTFRDITERRRSMDALRASEQRFKALFDQAAVGVAQVHAVTGRFTQINQRFCEITGRSREELEALTLADISHPQDLGQSLEIARQIKEGPGREITRENRYVRKDGAALWINLTMSAMWAPGSAPDFLIAVAQDVTSRKKLEEQVQQTQKMEAIGTLAGGIAHDFNNILAAIMGYAELARMKLPDNREVRAYLDAVLQASNRATALVRQILAFSRPQQLERRPVELRSVVTEALGLLRASIPSTIGFKSEFAADTPLVFADATQVHQVLMNLGTNAWHAMTDRPGLLQVTLERCVIDDAHESARARLAPGVYARVSVSDTGTGMDAGRLRRIFDPFFTTKPPGEGTGLGLAVVHGIMAGHEGAVTVYSEPGQGTVFHLYFPAYAGAPGAIVADAGAIPRGEGEQILFIDDEESLARLGGQTLATLGYEVEVATQPSAALALVRASPQRFALVITDQTMPGMTGLDLAGKVRGLRPDLPVILTTGYGLALPAERLAEAGLHQVMLKPVGMRALGIAVHAALHPGPKPPL